MPITIHELQAESDVQKRAIVTQQQQITELHNKNAELEQQLGNYRELERRLSRLEHSLEATE